MRSVRRWSMDLPRSRRLDSLGLIASSVNLCSATGPTSSRPGQYITHTTQRLSPILCAAIETVSRQEQEAQLLLGDRATRKHAKDS